MTLEAYRKSLSNKKHEAILTAAREIFLDKGLNGAGMGEIAAAAGVSTATLYRHFASKEELFGAIVELVYSQFGEAVQAEAASLPVRDALRAIADDFTRLHWDLRIADFMRLVIAEIPNQPGLGGEFTARGYGGRLKDFAAYLQQQVDNGALAIGDTELAARQFTAMINEFWLWPRILRPDYSMSDEERMRHIDEAVATFMARYGTAQPGGG